MSLNAYLHRLPTDDDRDAFAVACGTSIGHLRNVGYGSRTASAALARAVEQQSKRSVMRWHLRPDDWFRIWPELVRLKGAPPVPAKNEADAEAKEGA